MIWTAFSFIVAFVLAFAFLAFVLSRFQPPKSWGPWPLITCLACALGFAYFLTNERPLESVAPDYDQQGVHR